MSEILTITAKIKKIFETVQITDNFKKREFVAETGDQYPQLIKFELTQDKTDLVQNIKRQVKAKIFFNLRGREYTGKDGQAAYFNSLNVWKIEILDEETEPEKSQKTEPEVKLFKSEKTNAYNDDLPF